MLVLIFQTTGLALRGQASTITSTSASASSSDATCYFVGPSEFVRVQGPQTISASGCLEASGGAEIDGVYSNNTWNAPPLYLSVMVEGQAALNVTVVIDTNPGPTIWQRDDSTTVVLNNLGPVLLPEEFEVGVTNIGSTNNSVSIAINFSTQSSSLEQSSTSSAGGAPEFSTQDLAGIVFLVAVIVLAVVTNVRHSKEDKW